MTVMPVPAELYNTSHPVMSEPEIQKPTDEARLEGWKQIAAHLNKSERTVRRWHESEGLPVHRLLHQQRGSVWAFESELKDWIKKRTASPGHPPVPADCTGPARTRLWVAVTAAALTGFLMYLAARPRLRANDGPPLLNQIPLTSLPGNEYGASFSPGGDQIVFFWSGHGKQKAGLYVRSLASDDLHPLITATDKLLEFIYSPAWSPDGASIAFLRRTPDRDTWLCVIPAHGGAERRLVRLSKLPVMFLGNYHHVSWTPDSSAVLAPMSNGEGHDGIHRIDVQTGSSEQLTVPAVREVDCAPSLAPGGRSFAFLRNCPFTPDTPPQEVLRQDLRADGSISGEPQVLLRGPTMASGLAWHRSGEELILCNSRVPTIPFESRLYRLPARLGGLLTPLGLDACMTPAVRGPLGNRPAMLVYARTTKSASKLWRAGLKGLHDSSPIALSSQSEFFPEISPQGGRLVFVSDRTGHNELWIARTDDSSSRRLTDGSGIIGPARWSPNGKQVVYHTPTQIVVLDVDVGAPRQIGIQGEMHANPSWSHDGAWIFYAVGNELWQTSPDGVNHKRVRELLRHVSRYASPDGTSLYVTRMRKRLELYKVLLNGGPEELVQDDLASVAVAITKDSLFYHLRSDSRIYRQSLRDRTPTPVGTITPDAKWLTVSPDGSFAIWQTSPPDPTDLVLVPNFK